MIITIGVTGACGRMGQRILQLAHADHAIDIGAAIETPTHPSQGRDAGAIAGIGEINVPIAPELELGRHIDVMIDFSSPAGTMTVLPSCIERRIALVVATTGHSAGERELIEKAASTIAVLIAANTSLAVNVLMKLAGQAGALLRGRDFDVEILERHHRFKKDSPSGTALQFAQVIQEAMGQSQIKHGREGQVGERSPTEIGIHAIRAGDNVGEHTIVFGTLGETLELTHRAQSRDCYARGALQAAKFLASKSPGRYTMNDVLGL